MATKTNGMSALELHNKWNAKVAEIIPILKSIAPNASEADIRASAESIARMALEPEFMASGLDSY